MILLLNKAIYPSIQFQCPTRGQRLLLTNNKQVQVDHVSKLCECAAHPSHRIGSLIIMINLLTDLAPSLVENIFWLNSASLFKVRSLLYVLEWSFPSEKKKTFSFQRASFSHFTSLIWLLIVKARTRKFFFFENSHWREVPGNLTFSKTYEYVTTNIFEKRTVRP